MRSSSTDSPTNFTGVVRLDLPVPLPSRVRNSAGAIEHLAGELEVEVRRHGRLVWSDHSSLAALEHGGLERAEEELRRRGVPEGETGAPPTPQA